MDTIQIAKDLLRKGIAINDTEIIGMAHQILGLAVKENDSTTQSENLTAINMTPLASEKSKTRTKRGRSKSVEKEISADDVNRSSPKASSQKVESFRTINLNDFRNNKSKDSDGSKKRKVKTPVSSLGKKNIFSDNGIDAKDEENITPTVKLTPRERPRQEKVRQSCEYCKTSVFINPIHAREFFVCDECLENKTKGR